MVLENRIVITVGVVVYLLEPVVGRSINTTEEVVEILCTKRGGSELGMLYIITLILKVLLKEHRIRILTIDALAATDEVKAERALIVAGKAIAVSHGVADGHIVNFFFLFFMIVLADLCSGADCGSAHAEQDSKNHDKRNELETKLS